MYIEELLSVSCIGSNGLKLFVNHANCDYTGTFSILYRIEWVETCLMIVRTQSNSIFQYPVSDRMG